MFFTDLAQYWFHRCFHQFSLLWNFHAVHHWHHGIEKEAINKNYAVHFPVLDMIFGTYYFPKNKWPQGYGIEGNPVPRHYWNQFLYPFFKRRMENKIPTPNLSERQNEPTESKDAPTRVELKRQLVIIISF